MSTPGERFADAANELIKGIQEIQRIVHRPYTVPRPEIIATAVKMLLKDRDTIADLCEHLIGPYTIIVADLSQEDFKEQSETES